MRDFVQVEADFLEVAAEVHLVRPIAAMNAFGGGAHRRDPVSGFLQLLRELWVTGVTRLELEYARHDGETVLYPVCDLFEERLLLRQRRLEAAVLPLALDRHAQYIGGTLQEREIISGEFVLRSAV